MRTFQEIERETRAAFDNSGFFSRLLPVIGPLPGQPVMRFPGVRADARALGVTAPHLWHMLAGHRHSRRLMAAYQALKQGQTK